MKRVLNHAPCHAIALFKIGDKVKIYASSSTDSGYGDAIYMGEMDGQPMVKIEETGRILNTRRVIVDGNIIYAVNLKPEVIKDESSS